MHRWSRRELARRLRAEAARRGDHSLPDDENLIRSVRRWEAGTHRPGELYVGLLSTALDPGAVARVEAAASGHVRPDLSTAGHLAAVVHELRERDDTAPTGSLLPAAGALSVLTEQMTVDARLGEQREAGQVAAEAATLHWWLAVDAGHYDLARTVHDRAMALAVEWGVPALVGHLLGWRAGLALAQGDLTTTIRLARRARLPQWGMSAGGTAWATAYEARAHVLRGAPDAGRALDTARAAYDAVDPSSEPPWLYWLSGHILRLDRLDMELLAEGTAAVPAVEAALAELPTTRMRDAAWYRAHIAAAQARAGDIDGSTRNALEAARLSRATGTQWTLAELWQLARQRPELAQVGEALADTAGP